MSPLTKLSEILATFPGIGPRQAERLAYFLSSKDKGSINSLRKTLEEVSEERRRCLKCRSLFFSKGVRNTCDICSSKNRDSALLIVTDTEINRNSIERSGVSCGNYFIISKTLPMTETDGSKLPVRELKDRIDELYQEGLKEVFLVFNYTPEGEHTGKLIKREIGDLCKERSVKVSLPGRGFSSGTEIQYSDTDTLKQAFGNRKENGTF